MATPRGDPRASPAPCLPLLLFLGVLVRVRGDDSGDFALADALDEPRPTTPRPRTGLYPRLPEEWAHDTQEGERGTVDPWPRPRPQARLPHVDRIGGGGHPDGPGDSPGSKSLAAILSPAVSFAVLVLLGAGVGFVRSGRGPRWYLGNRGEAPPLPDAPTVKGTPAQTGSHYQNRKSRGGELPPV